jgi:hypothetical protein
VVSRSRNLPSRRGSACAPPKSGWLVTAQVVTPLRRSAATAARPGPPAPTLHPQEDRQFTWGTPLDRGTGHEVAGPGQAAEFGTQGPCPALPVGEAGRHDPVVPAVNYPRRPFQSVEEACAWVAAFVDWYNHQHRHRGIRFVTPSQRHSGEAVAISRQRTRVYEQARQRHPRRWSRSTRCWRQPEVVWINPPPPDKSRTPSTLVMAA